MIYGHAGSKEETFFDSQAWLDSDCDDDFMSVNGGKFFNLNWLDLLFSNHHMMTSLCRHSLIIVCHIWCRIHPFPG